MKKFFLSAGALLLAAGLILSWVGIRMGGETKATVQLFGRSWDVYAAPTAGWNITTHHAGTATAGLEQGSSSVPVDAVTITDNNSTPFSALNLDVDLGSVTVAAADSYAVEIRSWGAGYSIEHWYSGDTLYIESSDGESLLPTSCGSEITVYVPSDVRLEMLYVDLDLGDLTLAGLDLECAELSLDLGNLTGDALTVATTFQAEASLGEVTLFGDLGEHVDISAALGSVQLGLSRPVSEYSWELEADLGSITVDGKQFTGSGGKEVNGGSGNRMLEVDADLGSITVDFNSDFAGEQSTAVAEAEATPRLEQALQGEATVAEDTGEYAEASGENAVTE